MLRNWIKIHGPPVGDHGPMAEGRKWAENRFSPGRTGSDELRRQPLSAF